MVVKKTYRNSKRRVELSDLFSEASSINYDNPAGGDYIRNVVAEMNSALKDGTDRQNKDEEKKEPETKELIPGETLIGTKTGTIQGELRQIRIFYGNFINPMNIHNGKYIPIKKKEYLKILNEFLNSDEGREYRKPSEVEISEAFTEVRKFVNRYIENLNRRKPGMMQPGRSPAASSRKEESAQEDKGGQPEQNSEEQRFADDLSEEERKEVEIIQAKQYTKQQMKEIRKGFDKERRRSSLAMVLLVLFAILTLGAVGFLIKNIVIASFQDIELQLTKEDTVINVGDPFNAQDYVDHVTEADNIYIIYPSLDTSSAGIYYLDYIATNNYKNVKKTLKAIVVDSQGPVITLNEEEIHLVRDRDEDNFDALSYVQEITDNVDSDLKPAVNELDWEKDEQILTYTVNDSAGNTGTATLKVFIEDKTVCDKHATYDEETNTCTCNSGYKGDGTACRLIQSSSSSSNSGNTGNSSSSGNSGGTGGGTTGGGGGDTPNPPSPPSPSSPFISASSVTVKVGTSLAEVQAKLVAGISSSSGYWVDYSAVNTSVPGSYPVYIHGNDGAEGSCSVTVVE